MDNAFEELLERRHLKKTASRVGVLSVLKSRLTATSQPELEEIIGKQINRVTLYRILSSFEKKGIIHKILDSNGTASYALCAAGCTEQAHHDEHVHFSCTVCHGVYCLNDLPVSPIMLPTGFKASSLSLIASGICDRCNN